MKKSCKNCTWYNPKKKGVYDGWYCERRGRFYHSLDVCRYYEDKEVPQEDTINFMLEYLPDVEKIIVNGKHTILIFKDGSKSVVKCTQDDQDAEKGILYAWVKHHKKKKKHKIDAKTYFGAQYGYPTYGGTLTENITQAAAYDILYKE